MTRLIVDTDILIDVGRGELTVDTFLQKASATDLLAVSAVTHMELLVGCQNKQELRKMERFLHYFELLRLTMQVSDTAVNLLKQYRLNHGLQIPDALIAATALTYQVSMISKNQRDYKFIKGLHLKPYPQVTDYGSAFANLTSPGQS